jgi:hypothetical protein
VSHAVVEYFQTLKYNSSSFFLCLKTLPKYISLFKRGNERFSHRVVVAVSGTAHARDHTVSRKDPSNTMVGILLPTIRVENQSGSNYSPSQSHLQRIDNRRRSQMVRNRMADHPPRPHIFYCRQVQPSLVGIDIGNVRVIFPRKIGHDFKIA